MSFVTKKITGNISLLVSAYLAAVCILTSCSQSEDRPDIKMTGAEEATSIETVENAVGRIKDGKYKNLSAEHTQLNVNKTNSIDILNVNNSSAEMNDYYAAVCRFSSAFLGQDYDENNIYFISDEHLDTDAISDMENAYSLKKYKKDVLNGEISTDQLGYYDKERRCLINIGRKHSGGWLIHINDDSELEIMPSKVPYLFWMPSIDENVIKTEKVTDLTQQIKLSDKNEKIDSIIKNNQKDIANISNALDKTMSIDERDHFISHEENACYLVTEYAYQYNNIDIESISSLNSYHFLDMEEEEADRYSLWLNPRAVNVSSKGFSYYYGDIPWQIAECEYSISNICSPETAIEIASYKLSEDVIFDVESFSLCYLQKDNIMKPYWRIMLKNTIDSTRLVFLVDCETGDDISYILSDIDSQKMS